MRLPEKVDPGAVFPLRALVTNFVHRHPGTPDTPVCGLHQSDGDPTLDISAGPRVRLPPLFCEANSYPFQGGHLLHLQQRVNERNKGIELSNLLEASLQIHLLLSPLRFLQTLSWRYCRMGLSICVHDAHVVNTVSTILPEVTEQELTPLFRGLYQWRVRWDCCGFGTCHICLRPLHCATCEDEGVVAHVRGGERFTCQVHNPVTELVVTRRDKATQLTVNGMEYGTAGVTAIVVMREV